MTSTPESDDLRARLAEAEKRIAALERRLDHVEQRNDRATDHLRMRMDLLAGVGYRRADDRAGTDAPAEPMAQSEDRFRDSAEQFAAKMKEINDLRDEYRRRGQPEGGAPEQGPTPTD